jgi:hypothetical protein
MTAYLCAHEQLGHPLGIGRPRAHARDERARELQSRSRRELAHAPRSSFPLISTPTPPPLAATEDIPSGLTP